MANVTGNTLLNGWSGSVGGISVYKVGDQTYARSKAHQGPKVWHHTEQQLQHQSKFKLASQYAKFMKNDAIYIAELAARKAAGETYISSYRIAIEDYMTPPKWGSAFDVVDPDDKIAILIDSISVKTISATVHASTFDPTSNADLTPDSSTGADAFLAAVTNGWQFDWTAYFTAHPGSTTWHWLALNVVDLPGNEVDLDYNDSAYAAQFAPSHIGNLTRFA